MSAGLSPPIVSDYGKSYQPPSIENAQGNAEYRQWNPMTDPFAQEVAMRVRSTLAAKKDEDLVVVCSQENCPSAGSCGESSQKLSQQLPAQWHQGLRAAAKELLREDQFLVQCLLGCTWISWRLPADLVV